MGASGAYWNEAGKDDQLSNEFIGQVVEAVRPHRVDGHGARPEDLDPAHPRPRGDAIAPVGQPEPEHFSDLVAAIPVEAESDGGLHVRSGALRAKWLHHWAKR